MPNTRPSRVISVCSPSSPSPRNVSSCGRAGGRAGGHGRSLFCPSLAARLLSCDLPYCDHALLPLSPSQQAHYKAATTLFSASTGPSQNTGTAGMRMQRRRWPAAPAPCRSSSSRRPRSGSAPPRTCGGKRKRHRAGPLGISWRRQNPGSSGRSLRSRHCSPHCGMPAPQTSPQSGSMQKPERGPAVFWQTQTSRSPLPRQQQGPLAPLLHAASSSTALHSTAQHSTAQHSSKKHAHPPRVLKIGEEVVGRHHQRQQDRNDGPCGPHQALLRKQNPQIKTN